MSDSLLTLICNACDRLGLVRPTVVYGSSAEVSRQLLAMANAVGKDLQRRHDWQILRKERTFTASGGSDTFTFPTDFDRMLPRTFWNRTRHWPVVGPLTVQKWQQLKAAAASSVIGDSYIIRAGSMLMYPTPEADNEYYFEYISTRWCGISSDTTPTATAFAGDTNIQFFDDELFTQGIVWRYKRMRGFDYADDMQDYELRLGSLIGHDGSLADLTMGETFGDAVIGDPVIPDGSWT